ncbi:flagellar assembly protein FliW [Salidesulfovibrio onnuriiensis]|uniref:flagellar assembly protein FliW n=1 Tax=Salidesulfovibrio onnuriiensis TaxID=2583823 RepID=UPI0011C99EA6|nr:flagellar assembly protein FliW [Salidesulfovibrio onnuriiensis]
MARERKQVIKTRLGDREIDPSGIIYFPRGLIGLEDKREYVLLQVRDDSPFLLLQCVTDPGLGLLVADPYVFVKDYNIKLETPEKKILKLDNLRQLAVLVTVTIPQDKPEDTTLNLSGPILVNTEAKIGLQAPQVDSKYPTWYRLSDRKG